MNHRFIFGTSGFVLVLGIAWHDVFTLVIAWFLFLAASIMQSGHSRS